MINLELSEDQEKVFYALFWLGASGIGELALHVGFDEEKTSNILSELENMGLIHQLEGIAPRYVASFPLESLAQASKKSAEELVTSTSALNSSISQWNEAIDNIVKDTSASLMTKEQEVLDKIKQAITDETDKIKARVDSLARDVTNSVEQLKRSKDSLEDEKNRLISQATQALEETSLEVKNQAMQQLTEAIQQFRDAMASTVQQYKDSLPKGLNEYFNTLDGSLQQVLEVMQEAKTQQEMMIKDLSTTAENIFKEQMTALKSEWDESVAKSTEELESEAMSFTQKMEEQVSIIHRATVKLGDDFQARVSENLDNDITKFLETFRENSNQAKASSENQAEQLEKQATERMDELRQQLEKTIEDLTQQQARLQQTVQTTMTSLDEKLQKELESLKARHTSALKSLEDDLNAELTSGKEGLLQEISQQVTQLQAHLTTEKEKTIEQLKNKTNAAMKVLDDKFNRIFKEWQDLENQWQNAFEDTKKVVVKELEIPQPTTPPVVGEITEASEHLEATPSDNVTKLNQAALTQFQKHLQQFSKDLLALTKSTNDVLSKSTKKLLEQLADTSKINITKYHKLAISQLKTTVEHVKRDITELSDNVSTQLTENVATWTASLQELGNKMQENLKQRMETVQGKLQQLVDTKKKEFESTLNTLLQQHEETKNAINAQLENVQQAIATQLNQMKEKQSQLMSDLSELTISQVATNKSQVIELITKTSETLASTITSQVNGLKEHLSSLITALKDEHGNTTNALNAELARLRNDWLQELKEKKEKILDNATTLITTKLEEIKETITKFNNDGINHVSTTHQELQQRITESREHLRTTNDQHLTTLEQLFETLGQSLEEVLKNVTALQQSHYEQGHEFIFNGGKKIISDFDASVQQLSENALTPLIEQASTMPEEIKAFGNDIETLRQSLAEQVQQNVSTAKQTLESAMMEALNKLKESTTPLLATIEGNSKQVQASITELSTFLATFWSKVKAIEKPKLDTVVLEGIHSIREYLLHVLNTKAFRTLYVLSPDLRYLPLKQVIEHKKARHIRLYSYISNADHDAVKDLLKAGVQVFSIPENDNRWKGQLALHLAGDESLWASIDRDRPENALGLASSNQHFVEFVSEQVIKTLFTIRTQLNPSDYGLQ